MSELKARTARSIADEEEILELGADCPIEQAQVYLKSEADKHIGELKKEIAELKDEIKRLENVRKVHIESIESMCEGLKLNAKQICKTQRALWLARALALSRFDVDEYLRKYTHCNSRFWNDGFNTFNEACEQMQKAINIAEAKCRAKAEEYK